MKEQIKELRIQIDGLAQLTKELKPFSNSIITTEISEIEENYSETGILKVRKNESSLTGYKYHILWRTDEGTFRIGTNRKPITSQLLIEDFKVNFNSKEIEKAADSLYLAKAWLGKVLGELGIDSPYKSGYKTKEDIEPTADVQDWIYFNDGFKDKNHIEKADWLRGAIEKLIKEVKDIPTKDLSREFAIARTNSYNHLSEARFWLGFELERIKNEK